MKIQYYRLFIFMMLLNISFGNKLFQGYSNPNGHPFFVTLKANRLELEKWRFGIVVPMTNFLTISLNAQTWDESANYYYLTKDNFIIGYYLESPYGTQSYERFAIWEDYRLVQSNSRESFLWGFDVELHLPVYKIWERN